MTVIMISVCLLLSNFSLNFSTLNRFLHLVLVAENPELRTIVTQRPNYSVNQNESLKCDIEYTLTKLLDR